MKRVLRAKKDGRFVVIKYLSAVGRQFGWTQNPAEATAVSDEQISIMGRDIGDRGRFELTRVKEEQCTGGSQ